ncbi:MAG: hypothetical protein ABGX16_20040 [Pirellulales bacterium]
MTVNIMTAPWNPGLNGAFFFDTIGGPLSPVVVDDHWSDNQGEFVVNVSGERFIELAGDYNGNGVLDGADMLAWQRGESPDPLSAADLTLWEANYGSVAPLEATSTAVPEPASELLVLVTVSICLRSRQAPRVSTSR